MRILAIDPGTTTGFSTNEFDQRGVLDRYSLCTWQRNFFEETHNRPHWAMHYSLYKIDPDIIVCESFHFRQAQLGLNTDPAELIGVIKYFCQCTSVQLVMQNPSEKSKTGFWSDKKLKHLGLYVPSLPHGMDALRHRLHYEMKNNMFDLRLLKDV